MIVDKTKSVRINIFVSNRVESRYASSIETLAGVFAEQVHKNAEIVEAASHPSVKHKIKKFWL